MTIRPIKKPRREGGVMRWEIRQPLSGKGTILGPPTELVEVVPASFTGEDVIRVCEATGMSLKRVLAELRAYGVDV